MNQNTTGTTEVLTEIAQEVKESGTYELTDEDETRKSLGIPAENDYKHPDGSFDAELVARGNRDSLPITHRLYRLSTGDYIHVKMTTKNQGEYYTRYYVKGVGELEAKGRGVNRDKLEDEAEELAIPINDEVYNIIDDFVVETGEILAGYVEETAVIFTGSELVFETVDSHAGWGHIRDDVLEHINEDDLPAPEDFHSSRIETVDEVKKKEWGLLVERTFRCIDTVSLQSYNTDMIAEYAADVELNASSILED